MEYITSKTNADTKAKFETLCLACRTGDLEKVAACVSSGTRINQIDEWDYSPLILASLCGHKDVVMYLLANGAICDKDTFEGDRCVYGALNDEIRKILLSYDLSKAMEVANPFVSYLINLKTKDWSQNDTMNSTDVIFQFSAIDKTNYSYAGVAHDRLETGDNKNKVRVERCHRFILAARSKYFARKFQHEWKNKLIIYISEIIEDLQSVNPNVSLEMFSKPARSQKNAHKIQQDHPPLYNEFLLIMHFFYLNVGIRFNLKDYDYNGLRLLLMLFEVDQSIAEAIKLERVSSRLSERVKSKTRNLLRKDIVDNAVKQFKEWYQRCVLDQNAVITRDIDLSKYREPGLDEPLKKAEKTFVSSSSDDDQTLHDLELDFAVLQDLITKEEQLKLIDTPGFFPDTIVYFRELGDTTTDLEPALDTNSGTANGSASDFESAQISKNNTTKVYFFPFHKAMLLKSNHYKVLLDSPFQEGGIFRSLIHPQYKIIDRSRFTKLKDEIAVESITERPERFHLEGDGDDGDNSIFNASFDNESESARGTRIPLIEVSVGSYETFKFFNDHFYFDKQAMPLEISIEMLYLSEYLEFPKFKTLASLAIVNSGATEKKISDLFELELQIQKETEIDTDNYGRTHRTVGEMINIVDSSTANNKNIETLYEVLIAAWSVDDERLKQYVSRTFAQSLSSYIWTPQFASLVKQSAASVRNREETDTIELIDEIRYYLDQKYYEMNKKVDDELNRIKVVKSHGQYPFDTEGALKVEQKNKKLNVIKQKIAELSNADFAKIDTFLINLGLEA